MEEFSAISNPKRISLPTIQAYSIEKEETMEQHKPEESAPWEHIKRHVSAMYFIGAFVDLRKTSGGAIGNCPFHQDEHPSFSLNAAGNYWHCFAGCGGGSIIDFWMKWRDCDFPEAVDELVDLLGVNDGHHNTRRDIDSTRGSRLS